MLLFSVVLLIGTGVTITGLIIKDFTTAFVGSIASVFSLAFPIVHQFQLAAGETGRHAISTNILIFVAIFFVVLVIPGHILNCKNRKNKRCSKR